MTYELPHTAPAGKVTIERNGDLALVRVNGEVMISGIDPYVAAVAFARVGAEAGHGASKRLRALMQTV